MGTRCAVTFIDEDSEFSIYKHWDGYPDNILKLIAKSLKFAWELPRFEADEFAAAFVSAAKEKGGGDVRLTTSWKRHADLEFVYEVKPGSEGLAVSVFSALGKGKRELIETVKIVSGTKGN